MKHPPRLEASQYVGFGRYFLTFCTHNRRTWFRDPATVELVRLQIFYTGAQEEMETVAYCFMPDHLHLLTEARRAMADCTRFVKLVKQRSGYRFRRNSGQPLWQSSYYDNVLRNDDNADSVIRYIVENPLHAGLVARPADYPYWGSQRYSRSEILEHLSSHSPPGLRGRPPRRRV